jgi:hypothetical protein
MQLLLPLPLDCDLPLIEQRRRLALEMSCPNVSTCDSLLFSSTFVDRTRAYRHDPTMVVSAVVLKTAGFRPVLDVCLCSGYDRNSLPCLLHERHFRAHAS